MTPTHSPGRADPAALVRLKRRTRLNCKIILCAAAVFGACMYLYPSVLVEADDVGGNTPFVGLVKGTK